MDGIWLWVWRMGEVERWRGGRGGKGGVELYSNERNFGFLVKGAWMGEGEVDMAGMEDGKSLTI